MIIAVITALAKIYNADMVVVDEIPVHEAHFAQAHPYCGTPAVRIVSTYPTRPSRGQAEDWNCEHCANL